MELPSLPTDSLYKFLAIAGIALVLFAVTYPPAKAFEVQVEAAEVEALSEKLDVSLNNVERKIERLEKVASPSAEEVEAVRELHRQSQLEKVDARKAAKVLVVRVKAAEFYLKLSIVSLILGALMSLVGFTLWFVRIQRPLDRSIAKNGVRAS